MVAHRQDVALRRPALVRTVSEGESLQNPSLRTRVYAIDTRLRQPLDARRLVDVLEPRDLRQPVLPLLVHLVHDDLARPLQRNSHVLALPLAVLLRAQRKVSRTASSEVDLDRRDVPVERPGGGELEDGEGVVGCGVVDGAAVRGVEEAAVGRDGEFGSSPVALAV